MSSPNSHYSETQPALIAITLSIIVVCFIVFSFVYFCKFCFLSIAHTRIFQRSASETLVRRSPNASSPPYRGLDPSLLQAFPTFLYASVKDRRTEKNNSLECAICLVEFEGNSMLRLLTVCYHVFHQECIDLWLRSHKTCPVCRRDLDSNETRKSHDICDENEEDRRGGDVCIEVKEGEDDNDGYGVVSMNVRFVRSHSTGHSIVMIRGGDDEDDKYTLRLPQNVALKVFRGRHGYTKSCSSYKDMGMAARPNARCSNCGYDQTVFGCSSNSGTENILS